MKLSMATLPYLHQLISPSSHAPPGATAKFIGVSLPGLLDTLQNRPDNDEQLAACDCILDCVLVFLTW